MNKNQQERESAVANLKGFLRSGDTVYCITRSVSRSGMSRTVDFYAILIVDGKPLIRWLSALVSKTLRLPMKRDAVRVDGCGMDMHFATVRDLALVMFDDAEALTRETL